MFTQMKKRKYTQKRRAEQQQQTRQQIVEAAMALHEELGPANTTIKAVAERAGVQRLTVYRHFPDESALFQACTSHWLSLYPPPVLSGWEAMDGAEAHSRAALLAVFDYYRRTEQMWHGAYRDMDLVATLQDPMDDFEAYLDGVRDDLVTAWQPRGKRKKQLSLTLRHAMRFATWQWLKEEGLSDKQIVDLVMTWLQEKA
jgi:AcrR family transcriptional regulator